jgi:two-component system, OmpR family, phosphate regulon sensor histidine kinase PhoR
MKRSFRIIIVLIGLSIGGLFLLQASWLSNLLEITEVQLVNKVNEAGISVVNDIKERVYNGQPVTIPKKGGLGFNPDLHLHFIKPVSVDDYFTKVQVSDKISAAFKAADLQKLNFEFAITSTRDEYEMLSSNFRTEYWDTINNKIAYIAIIPESGSDFEGFSAFEKLIIVIPDYRSQVWASLKWVLLGAITFMIVILAAFFVTIRSLLIQKKLSEIKSDFINNMTHEFKTPIATISLAVDAMRNEKVQANPEKMAYFSGIIKDENIRMNKHVETILQAAHMDKEELELNLKPLHLHEIIKGAMDNHQLQLKDKSGEVVLHLDAKSDLIEADEIHFSNLISNLIDNAIKYAAAAPIITVSTYLKGSSIFVTVADNGIGMTDETVKRIFEKFYRAHTGNLHNVKGFGLGMSYVKTVIDAHRGHISVASKLGEGSVFTVQMDLAK